MSKPLVAIVGRPNVGKSTIINGLAQKRVSIVEDIPGVTRDRIYCDVRWLDREFTMIDTGGIEFRDEADQISDGIRQQAQLAMEEADVILFVVDARVGVQEDDQTIAGMLRRTGKPVVLCVNKVDSENQKMDTYEFYSLGIGDPMPVSAVNHLGFGDLLDKISEGFPPREEYDSPDIIRTAIVGRPNVGKSTLINSLLGYERSLVADEMGTTRDAVDSVWKYKGKTFILVDTAGGGCVREERLTNLWKSTVLSVRFVQLIIAMWRFLSLMRTICLRNRIKRLSGISMRLAKDLSLW